MSRLCDVCNYCYAVSFNDGKNLCDRCSSDFSLKNEPVRLCPVDGSEMLKFMEKNVIIDKCGKCHGVWLDGSEIELFKKEVEKDGYRQGIMWGIILG